MTTIERTAFEGINTGLRSTLSGAPWMDHKRTKFGKSEAVR